MERITTFTNGAYTAQNAAAAIARLAAWEDLHDRLVQEQVIFAQKMEVLRAEGKTKTSQFSHLFSQKLMNTAVITQLETAAL